MIIGIAIYLATVGVIVGAVVAANYLWERRDD